MANFFLSWIPSTSGTQTIQYKKSTDTVWIDIATVQSHVDSYNITNLDFDTWYDFRVKSNCSSITYTEVVTKIKLSCPDITITRNHESFDYTFNSSGNELTTKYIVQLFKDGVIAREVVYTSPFLSTISGTFEDLISGGNYGIRVVTYSNSEIRNCDLQYPSSTICRSVISIDGERILDNKISILKFGLNGTLTTNTTVNLMWRKKSDADISSNYNILPNAKINSSGNIISPFPYEIIVPTEEIVIKAKTECSSNYIDKIFIICSTVDGTVSLIQKCDDSFVYNSRCNCCEKEINTSVSLFKDNVCLRSKVDNVNYGQGGTILYDDLDPVLNNVTLLTNTYWSPTDISQSKTNLYGVWADLECNNNVSTAFPGKLFIETTINNPTNTIDYLFIGLSLKGKLKVFRNSVEILNIDTNDSAYSHLLDYWNVVKGTLLPGANHFLFLLDGADADNIFSAAIYTPGGSITNTMSSDVDSGLAWNTASLRGVSGFKIAQECSTGNLVVKNGSLKCNQLITGTVSNYLKYTFTPNNSYKGNYLVKLYSTDNLSVVLDSKTITFPFISPVDVYFKVTDLKDYTITVTALDCEKIVDQIDYQYVEGCYLEITNAEVNFSGGYFNFTWDNILNGSVGRKVEIYYSTNNGITWTKLTLDTNDDFDTEAIASNVLDENLNYVFRLVPKCEFGDGSYQDINYYGPEGCVDASFVSSPVFPNAKVGEYYSHSIPLNGTLPFTLEIIAKPSWLNISLVGNNLLFSGTPTNQFGNLGLRVNNCTSGSLFLESGITVDLQSNQNKVTIQNLALDCNINTVSSEYTSMSGSNLPLSTNESNIGYVENGGDLTLHFDIENNSVTEVNFCLNVRINNVLMSNFNGIGPNVPAYIDSLQPGDEVVIELVEGVCSSIGID